MMMFHVSSSFGGLMVHKGGGHTLFSNFDEQLVILCALFCRYVCTPFPIELHKIYNNNMSLLHYCFVGAI